MTGQPSPATSGTAPDQKDSGDFADFEWDLADEAEDTDFEIDAAATAFYMPQGNTVGLKAKALNGTPPFTFSWDFGDGSPKASGEMVKHTFTKLGNLDVTVTGTDASGATSVMSLGILIATPVDYAIRMQMDPKVIEDLKARYPESPAAAPAATP